MTHGPARASAADGRWTDGNGYGMEEWRWMEARYGWKIDKKQDMDGREIKGR
jgi:hypothetical protein